MYLRNIVGVLPLVSNTLPSNLTKISQNILRLGAGNCTSARDFGDSHVGTVGEMFEKWRAKFELEGVGEPVESIEHILSHVLGTIKISDVHRLKTTVLPTDKINQIDSLCSKRLKHVPVQYLLGEWSFRQLTLKMSPPVFIPRPETEQLVDIILPEIVRQKCDHVLDLCCGSGAIALSLLDEVPSLKATAIDQSKGACELTKENAQKTGLNNRIRVIQSQLERWHSDGDEKYRVIVSNPPYVYREDLCDLQPEIKLYEDLKALDGGDEGLEVIKTILQISARCLRENGKLFLEVEPRQPGLLRDYLTERNDLGIVLKQIYKDFCNKERFVELMKL